MHNTIYDTITTEDRIKIIIDKNGELSSLEEERVNITRKIREAQNEVDRQFANLRDSGRLPNNNILVDVDGEIYFVDIVEEEIIKAKVIKV